MRIFMILLLLMLVACQDEQAPEKEGMTEVTGKYAVELQKTACTAAHDAGTCATKLPNLGFITQEECCDKFEKCC